MNNPYSQPSQQHSERNRGFGRSVNDRWSNDENRALRRGWRDDYGRTSNRFFSGEQGGYAQSRSAPSSAGQFDEYGQEWQGGNDDYEDYANQWAAQQHGALNPDYEGAQQGYSFAAPERNQYRGDYPRGGQGRGEQWQGRPQAYADSSRFGYRQPSWRSGPQSSQGYGSPNVGSQNFDPQNFDPQNYGGSQYYGGSQNPSYGSSYQGSQHQGPQSFGGNYGGALGDYQPMTEQRPAGAYGMETQHTGKGPKDYVRTDERIREELCEWLSDDPRIDASEVAVEVREGIVTLEGSVPDRIQKHRVEDIADSCSGVKDVRNSLRVSRQSLGQEEGRGAMGERKQQMSSATETGKQANKEVNKETRQ